MAYTKNTWKTDDIITADKLNNIESGIAQQDIRVVTFSDFNEVVTNINKYTGLWIVNGANLLNSPVPISDQYAIIEVIQAENGAGLITYNSFTSWAYGRFYTYIDRDHIVGWEKLPEESKVVHNTGTETVSGDKTFAGNTNFTGQTTLTTGNYGLRVTTTGIQKTSDGGTTWVNI